MDSSPAERVCDRVVILNTTSFDRERLITARLAGS
jgi:hypothetical protein